MNNCCVRCGYPLYDARYIYCKRCAEKRGGGIQDYIETEIATNTEQTLVVFTNNGQTYHFYGVENFKPTTTGFTFEYTGKATGVIRQATFNNTSVAGYAIAEEEAV